jgi:hypothetical protein
MESINQTIIMRQKWLSVLEGAGLLALSCPLLLWSFGAIAFGGMSGLWVIFALPVVWLLVEVIRLVVGFKSPRKRFHGSLRRLALSLIAAAIVVWGVRSADGLSSWLNWFLLGFIPVLVSCFYHIIHRDTHENPA